MYTYWPSWVRGLRLAWTRKPFHVWQAIWAPLIVLIIFFFYGLVALGRLADALLFARYKHKPVVAPIYIVANMRSGTTFLHRLMENDPQFSTLKLFHTLFPAISYYRLFDVLGRIDRMVGRPFGHLIGLIDSIMFSTWDGIHATGFGRAEEDEMYWLYAGLSPAITMFFPYPKFDEAMTPDQLPPAERQRVADYYEDNIRRHLFARPGTRLLAKNALIAGRWEIAHERMPDMKIVHLVRHPYEVIPSKISMFAAVWKLSLPGSSNFDEMPRYIADVTIGYYRKMDDFVQRLRPENYVFLRYEDLIADPATVVDKVYTTFDLTLDQATRAAMQVQIDASRSYQSGHSYSLEQYGLQREDIYQPLQDLFEKYGWER